MTYYAVIQGLSPGVYTTYHDAITQTRGVPGSYYKVCSTRAEAEHQVAWDRYEYENKLSKLAPNRKRLSLKQPLRVSKPTRLVSHNGTNLGVKAVLDTLLKTTTDIEREITKSVTPSATHTYRCTLLHSSNHRPEGKLRLLVYTDGSCYSTVASAKRPVGLGVYFGPRSPDNFSGPLAGPIQSKKRADLAAILVALKIISSRSFNTNYTLRTNSEYAINCIFNKWQVEENIDLINPLQSELHSLKSKGTNIRLELDQEKTIFSKRVASLARKGIPGTGVLGIHGETFNPDNGTRLTDLEDCGLFCEASSTWLVYTFGWATAHQLSLGVYFGEDNPDNFDKVVETDVKPQWLRPYGALAAVQQALWIISQRSFTANYKIRMLEGVYITLSRNETHGRNAKVLETIARLKTALAAKGTNVTYEVVPDDEEAQKAASKVYHLARSAMPEYHEKRWECHK